MTKLILISKKNNLIISILLISFIAVNEAFADSRNETMLNIAAIETPGEDFEVNFSDQTCGDNHRPLRLSRKKGWGYLGAFKIGITAGTSHSFSDIHRNKYLGYGETISSLWKNAGLNGGIYFNYRHVNHFGLGAGLNLIHISGTAHSEDNSSIPADDIVAGFAFENQILEFNGRLMFYVPLATQRIFDIYAFVGLSLYYNFLELRDQNQLVTFPTEDYDKLQMALPLGVGFSFKVGRRFSFGFESGYRYTPFNYLDGISPPDTKYDAFLLNQVKFGFFLN